MTVEEDHSPVLHICYVDHTSKVVVAFTQTTISLPNKCFIDLLIKEIQCVSSLLYFIFPMYNFRSLISDRLNNYKSMNKKSRKFSLEKKPCSFLLMLF